MRWDRISVLVDQIKDDLGRDGYVLFQFSTLSNRFLIVSQVLPSQRR